MTAQNSKTGGDATPAPEPAASQAPETQGANTAEAAADTFDVAGALGLPAEGQETGKDETEPVDPDAKAQEEAAQADTEAEADDDTPDDEQAEPGKSEDDEAQSDEAEPEPGASEEDEPAEPAEGDKKPEEGKAGTPKWAQKRFDELTAAKKLVEDDNTRLREQLATAQAAASGSLQSSPLDFIETPEQLAAHANDVARLNDWAIRNRNGGKLGEREYSADEVAAIEADTLAQMRTDIPKRKAYVEHKRGFDQIAVQTYPWLRDTKQGDGATAQKVIESYPQLRALPNYRLVIGNAMAAEKLRQAGVVIDAALIERLGKEAAAKRGNAKPGAAATRAPLRKAPPGPARAGTMPGRTTPRVAQQRAAEARVTGPNVSMDDLAASIAAKL